MAPILVVVGLLMLGAAIVAWATRRTAPRPHADRRDQDAAWNDPIPAPRGSPDPTRRTGAVFQAQPGAFDAAPVSSSHMAWPAQPATTASFPPLVLTASEAHDPFAHAPARSDPSGVALETRH